MAKLPKHLIKKYGISKRAWAEFRKSKKSYSTQGVGTMAKRKVKTSYRRGRKSPANMSKVTNILTGAAVAALYEVFVSPMIPLSRNVKNIMELVLGIMLLAAKNQMLKAAGVALITINAFEIIVPLIRGVKAKSGAVASDVDVY